MNNDKQTNEKRKARTVVENFINKPIPHEWTHDDIIRDYEKCQDKKKVAAIWRISVKEVNEVLKQVKA
ncbi:hypothetical protein [Lacrimispora sp.]|uniref:hypothetical protein n=1 Tax=Lacrimispora sp. TaxID=2719234 RepID=UPI0028A9EF66|nr:hypothetical protein [Lacrimispora sp.]